MSDLYSNDALMTTRHGNKTAATSSKLVTVHAVFTNFAAVELCSLLHSQLEVLVCFYQQSRNVFLKVSF